MKEFVNQYSRLDRILHRISFASSGVQVALADLEDRIYGKQLGDVSIRQPVFVTALPRAGTTLLLDLLHNTSEFATHTYRSMPFVLCPMIWNLYSNSLRSHENQSMERAHGDGMMISVDSPEAFEEIIWSYFWRSHYRTDHIAPWSDQRNPEFVVFFRNHIRKQLLLADTGSSLRYISKNNLNIARISYIESMFSDAMIVVPFRDPLNHASSLLKQHLNFLKVHQEDRFSKQYMLGIGHYDFGENFLPVDFQDWLDDGRRRDATRIAFWLEYWIAAYRHVLSTDSARVHLISFDELTRCPVKTLQSLSDALAIRHPEHLVKQSGSLRQAPAYSVSDSDLPQTLVKEAKSVFDKLMGRAHDI